MRSPLFIAACAAVVAVSGCATDAEVDETTEQQGTSELANEPFDSSAEVRPELMRVVPEQASPGEIIELHFPEETERGIAFVLEVEHGDTWALRYFLVAGTKDVGALEWWTPEDAESRGWDDVGIGGAGPDFLEIPEPTDPGDYRICTANAGDEFCARIQIVSRDLERRTAPVADAIHHCVPGIALGEDT